MIKNGSTELFIIGFVAVLLTLVVVVFLQPQPYPIQLLP